MCERLQHYEYVSEAATTRVQVAPLPHACRWPFCVESATLSAPGQCERLFRVVLHVAVPLFGALHPLAAMLPSLHRLAACNATTPPCCMLTSLHPLAACYRHYTALLQCSRHYHPLAACSRHPITA